MRAQNRRVGVVAGASFSLFEPEVRVLRGLAGMIGRGSRAFPCNDLSPVSVNAREVVDEHHGSINQRFHVSLGL